MKHRMLPTPESRWTEYWLLANRRIVREWLLKKLSAVLRSVSFRGDRLGLMECDE